MSRIDPKKAAAKKKAAPPPAASKEVARRDNTKAKEESAAVGMPSDLLNKLNAQFAADARSGMEDMTTKDMAIPRLSIIQPLSHQLDKNHEMFLEGAEVGMVCDNVQGRLYDATEPENGEGGGILVILVQFSSSDIEWIPRKKGGGFVANHGPNSGILSQTTRDKDTGANTLPNGNEIVPTVEYFAFIVDEQEQTYDTVVMSFFKTLMPEARRLATVVSTYQISIPEVNGNKPFTPALFYRAFRFFTVPKSNEKGRWFIWKFKSEGPTVDLFPDTGKGVDIYNAAAALRDAVRAGKVKVKDPDTPGAAGPSGAGGTDEAAPM